jgi:hypothetical protein
MGLRGAAYWLFPDGTVRTVGTSHVAELIQDPAAFGWTRAEIEAAYARHGEPLGWEGFAREELIRATVRRGFVRVREYIGREGCRWSLTVGVMDAPTVALISAWRSLLVPAWKSAVPVRVLVLKAAAMVEYGALSAIERLRE